MHASIDLETLGEHADSVICQIGIALFDPHEQGIHHCLQLYVDPEEQLADGRAATWKTIRWWLQQSDAARAALCRPPGKPRTLIDALEQASQFLMPYDLEGVWGYGASFDLVILKDAYRWKKLTHPWNFRRERCLRELAAQHGEVGQALRPEPTTAHVAMDDAIAQAQWVQALLARRRTPS